MVDPGRAVGSSAGSVLTRAFARTIDSRITSRGSTSAGDDSNTSRIVASDTFDASRPPAWPPMPSHTTHKWPARVARTAQASSFTCFDGSRPGSVRHATSTAGRDGSGEVVGPEGTRY